MPGARPEMTTCPSPSETSSATGSPLAICRSTSTPGSSTVPPCVDIVAFTVPGRAGELTDACDGAGLEGGTDCARATLPASASVSTVVTLETYRDIFSANNLGTGMTHFPTHRHKETGKDTGRCLVGGETVQIPRPFAWILTRSTLMTINWIVSHGRHVGAATVLAATVGFVVATVPVDGQSMSTGAAVRRLPFYPRFAYVADAASDTVSTYSVNASTGQLRHTGYVIAGDDPRSVTIHPTGNFAYV